MTQFDDDSRRAYGRTINCLAYLVSIKAIVGHTTKERKLDNGEVLKPTKLGPCQTAALVMRRGFGSDTRTAAKRIAQAVKELGEDKKLPESF